MFPIIPYNLNLNQSSRTISYSELYHSTTKTPKVIASCDIPRDATSEPLRPEEICGDLDINYQQIELELDDKKQIICKGKRSKQLHWIRAIRLADDCHSYNARICTKKLQNQNKSIILMQVIKSIKKGQEILLWFSEEILANLQMAFLTPANIQDQKKYVCHICSSTFEYPNPLKLHLTLDCDKQEKNRLWDRIARIIESCNMNTSLQSVKPSKDRIPNFNLTQCTSEALKISSSGKTTYLPLNLSPGPRRIFNPYEIQRPFSEPSATLHSSAFRPYASASAKLSPNNNSIRLCQSLANIGSIPSNYILNNQTSAASISQNSFSMPVDLNHAAQMETLVSNLGKSKQGHLCIYCGKCYSRKYGLKIHIRTHTGYKPLKCKFCLRPFGDPSNLNKHVRLHAEGDTPYKCELCGKVLVRRRDLERHLRSRHMGEMHLGEPVEESTISSSDHSDN